MTQVHSHTDLLEILREWHTSPPEHPAPFPGHLAGKKELTSWLDDVNMRAAMHNISQPQWANAILAWIPATPEEGENGFKHRLLKLLRENVSYQLENMRFWEWGDFKRWFFHLCGKQFVKVTGYDLFLRSHKGPGYTGQYRQVWWDNQY